VRGFFPARARAKSAPAMRCCAFDFAGIDSPSCHSIAAGVTTPEEGLRGPA
jgi:hypothetical protein